MNFKIAVFVISLLLPISGWAKDRCTSESCRTMTSLVQKELSSRGIDSSIASASLYIEDYGDQFPLSLLFTRMLSEKTAISTQKTPAGIVIDYAIEDSFSQKNTTIKVLISPKQNGVYSARRLMIDNEEIGGTNRDYVLFNILNRNELSATKTLELLGVQQTDDAPAEPSPKADDYAVPEDEYGFLKQYVGKTAIDLLQDKRIAQDLQKIIGMDSYLLLLCAMVKSSPVTSTGLGVAVEATGEPQVCPQSSGRVDISQYGVIQVAFADEGSIIFWGVMPLDKGFLAWGKGKGTWMYPNRTAIPANNLR